MANGVGLTLGPVISSMVFGTVGYSGTFFFFAILISVIGVITVYCMLPKRLDGKDEEEEVKEEKKDDEEAAESEDATKKVTWCVFFRNKRSALAIFVCFMSCLCM